MLPTIHARALQGLLAELEACMALLPTTPAGAPPAASALLQGVGALLIRFHTQILPLTAAELPPELAGVWQALQTELHRSLRLLQAEVLRLQAARQPDTQQQRLQTVRDRLAGAIAQVRSLLEA